MKPQALRGIGLAAFASLALANSGPALQPSPLREPRPAVRYLTPRSKRKMRLAAMQEHRRNRTAFEKNKKRPFASFDQTQMFIAKMNNWQRTQYSRELASTTGPRGGSLTLAKKWAAATRSA